MLAEVPLPLKIVLHVTIVYLALLIVLRLGGRREMSQLTPMDLLTMLLLSETVSPALTAGDDSLGSGLLAACLLVGLSVLTGWLTFRFRELDRAFEGRAEVLISRGKVRSEVMRHERITHQQLETALHDNGVLTVDEVEKAFVEPSGQITIVKRPDREKEHG